MTDLDEARSAQEAPTRVVRSRALAIDTDQESRTRQVLEHLVARATEEL